jgi:hypothetical protein
VDELVDAEHVFEVITTEAGTYLRSTWWNPPAEEPAG